MGECRGPTGEALILIATAVSLQLAAGRSSDEVALMAAFFTVLGDTLALIALRRDQQQGAEAEPGGSLPSL